jgi:hypothetical protein
MKPKYTTEVRRTEEEEDNGNEEWRDAKKEGKNRESDCEIL